MTESLKHIKQYDDLITKEAEFWGTITSPRPNTPQIWDDPILDEIFFGAEKKAIKKIVLETGGRTLDLGCGLGTLSLYFASQGLQVEGIDVSAERIGIAKKRAKEFFGSPYQGNPLYRCADLNTIELRSQSLDSIFAYGSLHHILQLDYLLEQVSKALKPSGVFVVYDYIGMGTMRKLLAAVLYAMLPTYKSYRDKLKLAKRLPRFLASEKDRRERLRTEHPNQIVQESPFEEISQQSIHTKISNRFTITRVSYHNPFLFYFAAKIRIPRSLKYTTAKLFKALDDWLVRWRIVQGSYVFIAAAQKDHSSTVS